MSKHLYTFANVTGITATVREIHLCIAYWGFLLLCLHAGTHLPAPFAKLSRRGRGALSVVMIIFSVVSAYGVFAFIKRGLPQYMFLKNAFVFFDRCEPIVFFFLDYVAIMVMCAFAGYLIITWLASKHTQKFRR